ncbi:MAG TPA: hypothetical protein PLX03_07320 [Candidatus Hydrogenedentes bacterium]|nr:hypothetical protein [Candidatus Hydrogenedentota bacterium]
MIQVLWRRSAVLPLLLIPALAAGQHPATSRMFPFCSVQSCQGQAQENELFEDSAFLRGFHVSAVKPWDQPNILGPIVPEGLSPSAPPVWRLAQWHSNSLLKPGTLSRDPEVPLWKAATDTKSIILRQEKGRAILTLECLGAREFAGRPRRQGEPWPHLLIEQALDSPPISKLEQLTFSIRFRIPSVSADPDLADKLDPGLHTAQTTAYWTVEGAGDDGHKDMFWFGIPLFDVRYPVPPAYCSVDTGFPGATEKYIYTVAGDRLWSGATGDGAWRENTVDLIPLLKEALRAIQEKGAMTRVCPDSLRLTSFNLGWEITGPYNASLEISGLSLRARPAVLTWEKEPKHDGS